MNNKCKPFIKLISKLMDIDLNKEPTFKKTYSFLEGTLTYPKDILLKNLRNDMDSMLFYKKPDYLPKYLKKLNKELINLEKKYKDKINSADIYQHLINEAFSYIMLTSSMPERVNKAKILLNQGADINYKSFLKYIFPDKIHGYNLDFPNFILSQNYNHNEKCEVYGNLINHFLINYIRAVEQTIKPSNYSSDTYTKDELEAKLHVVNSVLSKNPDLNIRTEHGESLLNIALYHHTIIEPNSNYWIKYLLNNGFNLKYTVKDNDLILDDSNFMNNKSENHRLTICQFKDNKEVYEENIKLIKLYAQKDYLSKAIKPGNGDNKSKKIKI